MKIWFSFMTMKQESNFSQVVTIKFHNLLHQILWHFNHFRANLRLQINIILNSTRHYITVKDGGSYPSQAMFGPVAATRLSETQKYTAEWCTAPRYSLMRFSWDVVFQRPDVRRVKRPKRCFPGNVWRSWVQGSNQPPCRIL